jgi:phosphonate transport system substrate-binding protein
MKLLLAGLAATTAMLALATGQAQTPSGVCPAEIRFGILPTEESTAKTRYAQLFEYLEKKTGAKFQYTIGADYAAIIIAMASKRLEAAWFGPESYIQATKQSKVYPLVMPENTTTGLGYYSSLYVKASSSFQNVQDLKGKTLAFVDPNSTSGYLFPMVHFLKDLKLNPNDYFGQVIFAGNHNASMLSLVNGKVDVAAIASGTVNNAIKANSIKEDELRVIWQSKLIPNSPISASDTLSSPCRALLQLAFLDLRDPKILEALTAKRFVTVNDATYNSVREADRIKEQLRKK